MPAMMAYLVICQHMSAHADMFEHIGYIYIYILSVQIKPYYGFIMVFFVATFGYPPKSQTIKKPFTTKPCQINPFGDLSPKKNHKKTLAINYTLTGGLNSVRGRFEGFRAIPKGKTVIFT